MATQTSTITNPDDMYRALKHKLSDVVPDIELFVKAKLAAQINALKIERNAVILGHNYMEPALFHSIPDFVGDSLELSRKAATTDKDIIVFCGVRFMAETAKILNPTKTVLIPATQDQRHLSAAASQVEYVRKIKRPLRHDPMQHLRNRVFVWITVFRAVPLVIAACAVFFVLQPNRFVVHSPVW